MVADPLTHETKPATLVKQIRSRIADLSEESKEKLVAAFAEHGWQSIAAADIEANGYPPYPQLSQIDDFVLSLYSAERPFSASDINEKTRRHLMARFTEVGLTDNERHDFISKVTNGATSSSKELTEEQAFEILEALEDLELERREAHTPPSSGSGSVVGATTQQPPQGEPEPPSVSYVSVSWSDGFTIDLTLPEIYTFLTELRSRYVK